MGYPSGPSGANAFLAHRDQNWLGSCSLEYRLSCYRPYVDDTFVLFKSSDHLKRFQSYSNSCKVNWKEQQNILRCQCYSWTM